MDQSDNLKNFDLNPEGEEDMLPQEFGMSDANLYGRVP